MFGWQDLTVAVVVVAAAAVTLRHLCRAWRGTENACGECAGCGRSSEGQVRVQIDLTPPEDKKKLGPAN